MDLYLIRHGDAEKSSPDKKDSERELTSQGKDVTRKAAENWRNFIGGFDHILSSPFKRALQTAEIVSEVFGNGKVITDSKLKSGSTTDDLIELTQIYPGKRLAIVGHQPDLSDFISDLVSGSVAYVEFRKSAIAKVSFGSKVKKGKGTLDFLIPPEIF